MRVPKKYLGGFALALVIFQSLILPVSYANAYTANRLDDKKIAATSTTTTAAGSSTTVTGDGSFSIPSTTAFPAPATPIPKSPDVAACDILHLNLFTCIHDTVMNMITDIMKGLVLGSAHFVALSVNEVLLWGNDITNNDLLSKSLEDTWITLRNVILGLLTLAILIIALANILHIQPEKYSLQVMIPKLFITIFMTIFSFAIATFLLDLVQSLQSLMMDEFAALWTTGVWYESYTKFSSSIGASLGATIQVEILIPVAIIGTILILLSGVALMLLLIIRIFMIYVLIAISPVAFMANLLPFTEKYYSQWWSEYMKWLWQGPVILLVMYIGAVILANSGPSNIVVAVAMISTAYVMAFFIPISMGNKLTGALGSALQGVGKNIRGWATAPITDRWGGFTKARSMRRDRDRRAREADMQRRLMGSKAGGFAMGTYKRGKNGHWDEDPGMKANLDAAQVKAFEEQYEGRSLDDLKTELQKEEVQGAEAVAILRLIHQENAGALKGKSSEAVAMRQKLMQHGNIRGTGSIVKDYAQDLYLDGLTDIPNMTGHGGENIGSVQSTVQQLVAGDIKKLDPARITEKQAKLIAKGVSIGHTDAIEAKQGIENYLSDGANTTEWAKGRNAERAAAEEVLFGKNDYSATPVIDPNKYNNDSSVRVR